MINPEKYGIEAGDTIRITLIAEGVVTEGFNPVTFADDGLSVNGLNLAEPGPSYGGPMPTVEILQKAEPKWHSAQVIKADTPFCREILVRRAGVEEELPWQGTNGRTEDRWFDHEELLHVEVLVQ